MTRPLQAQTSDAPRNVIQRIGRNRREFLRVAAGMGVSGKLYGFTSLLRAASPVRVRKAVIVTFGGGARDEETFAPEGQENIPNLIKELIPQCTFYTQMVNRGILGHYVATASLPTGMYERINNVASLPPEYPTVVEYFRKDLKRPPSDTWVVAPSNGFNRIGESSHRGYGPGCGAGVILSKQLFTAAVSDGTDYEHLLRDNYETPFYVPELGGNQFQIRRLEEILKLSLTDFAAHARMLSSPDELSVCIARKLMRELAPSLLWITLHDIDIAHSGSYSLYLEAIRRTDRLCAEIWKAIQNQPEYAGKTALFVLPDFGRDSDRTAGGNGFQHHRTGDASSRTTWMMALGPGFCEGLIVDRATDCTSLVPTLGSLLGLSPTLAQGKAIEEVT